jgi:hypothetical protein
MEFVLVLEVSGDGATSRKVPEPPVPVLPRFPRRAKARPCKAPVAFVIEGEGVVLS